MWLYPEIRTLSDYPRYHGRVHADKPALVHNGRTTTFGDLDRISNQIGNALIAQDVAPQGRVLYLGKNSDCFFYAMFGAVKARACFVPLNWRLSIAELAVVIADSCGTFAFVDEEFVETWRKLSQGSAAPIPFCTVSTDTRESDLMAQWYDAHPVSDPALPGMLDDAAIQLYTSGTTGAPKGVVISNASLNHMRLCEHFETALSWRDDDTYLFCTPNFHLVGVGLSLQLLYNGVTIVVERVFDPGHTLAAITAHRPTILVVVPAIIQISSRLIFRPCGW